MKPQCSCLGRTQRDFNPMCEIHSTKENLTEQERTEVLAELRKKKRQIESRIKALILGSNSNGGI